MGAEKNQSDWNSILKCFSLTGYLGFLMVGTIFAGFLIGWLIDWLTGTEMLFKIIFICLGVVGGFVNVYREIVKKLY